MYKLLFFRFTPEFESFLQRCLVRDVADRACVKELLQSAFLQRATTAGTLPSPPLPSPRCNAKFDGESTDDIPRLAALIQEEQYLPLIHPEADMAAVILSDK